MSRSNNTELKNPADKFFEWNGETGVFQYFDKTIGEKGQRVGVPLPFNFIVLDCLSAIRGFSDDAQSGFWSNEIRDFKKHKFNVRTKKGTVAEGLYDQVMSDPACRGAKYCQSVYIGFYEPSNPATLVIGNLQLTGAAVSAWIDFRKKTDVYKCAVKVDGFTEGKKGKVEFRIPTFKKVDVSEKTNNLAIDLDKQLQEYLNLYLAKTQTEVKENEQIRQVEERTQERVVQDAPPYTNEEVPALQENEENQASPEDDLPF